MPVIEERAGSQTSSALDVAGSACEKTLSEEGIKKGYRLSIFSGYASSAVTLLVTLFGVPMVSRCLSADQMAIYVSMSAVLSAAYSAQLGAGPGLTQRIAHAYALGQTRDCAEELGAAGWLVGLVAMLGLPLGLLAYTSGAFTRFYGLEAASIPSDSISFAFGLALFFALGTLLLSPMPRAQLGIHEMYFRNAAFMVANVVLLAGLLGVLPQWPLAWMALLVYSAPALVADIANSAVLFRRHRYLFRAVRWPARSRLLHALKDSIAYSVFELSGHSVREGLKGYVGRTLGMHALASYGLMLQSGLIMQALSNTLAVAVIPVITAYMAKGQADEARKVYSKVLVVLVGIYFLGLPVAWLAGPSLLRLLFGAKYAFTSWESVGICVLGTSGMFRYLNGFVQFSLGQARSSALFSIAGAVAAGGAVLLLPHHGLTAIVLAQGLAGLAVHGIAQTAFVFRAFSSEPTLKTAPTVA